MLLEQFAVPLIEQFDRLGPTHILFMRVDVPLRELVHDMKDLCGRCVGHGQHEPAQVETLGRGKTSSGKQQSDDCQLYSQHASLRHSSRSWGQLYNAGRELASQKPSSRLEMGGF